MILKKEKIIWGGMAMNPLILLLHFKNAAKALLRDKEINYSLLYKIGSPVIYNR